ncbi:MAG: ATP-dependent Clp protease adaptor ClpS [Vicingaceae bacterium]|nr:ATP-dependent Clp protease adaptor ClpS [Vicingaceae bacterium]
MQTEVLYQKEVKEKITKEHHLVVFNDNVNTFDFVIEMLVKVCEHDVIQAEQCTYIIHYKGKCAVKKGNYQTLKNMSEALSDAGLTVEIN